MYKMHEDEWTMGPDTFEAEVRRLAQRFTYPPTPDVAARLPQPQPQQAPQLCTQSVALRRRLAWALLALAVALALGGLFAVEPVRAWVAEILRLGAVRILSPAPPPARTPLPVHLGWGGQTELAQAAAELPFPVQLPALPADLGLPDAAYLQDLNGPALLLVWMDPAHPRRVRLTLHALSSEALAYKMDPPTVEETTVHGQPALWTDGPYLVALRSGEWVAERLVTGHVLIWTEAGVTYRLESDLPLAQAVTIAESLHPWAPP